jgi:hypothetical protein
MITVGQAFRVKIEVFMLQGQLTVEDGLHKTLTRALLQEAPLIGEPGMLFWQNSHPNKCGE